MIEDLLSIELKGTPIAENIKFAGIVIATIGGLLYLLLRAFASDYIIAYKTGSIITGLGLLVTAAGFILYYGGIKLMIWFLLVVVIFTLQLLK